MKNVWLEVDEPRKHFFKVAQPLLSYIAWLTHINRLEELYDMYASFVAAYKKLDTLLRLYDQSVITVFDGVEAAIAIYRPSDHRFDEIFANT